MKRLLLVMQLIMFLQIGYSQYNLLLIPTGNIYLRSQLWNLSVSNANSTSVNSRIRMQLKDQVTNQVVLSGVSAPFVLNAGSNLIQMQTLEPIVYNNAANGTSDNNMLQIGKYQVCYQLLVSYSDGEAAVADDCELLTVEPMSPPVLNFPENDSVVTNLTPTFLWIPPTPLTMFANLNYDIIISEVFNGQSTTDAIQHNLPVQEYHALQLPTYNYALQGVALEAGKTYAWQVVAREGQQYAAKSDVWRFKIIDKRDSVLIDSHVYLLLDEKVNGTETISTDTLHIKYVSNASTGVANVVFKDGNGAVMFNVSKDIKQGDNYWDIILNRKFDRQKPYQVVATQNDREIGSLSFQIK